MRNIKYIGTKPTEDAFFDRTQIIWTPGKVDTVLDDAVATEMLRFAEFEDAGDSRAFVGSISLDPTTGAMQIGGSAPTSAQRASVRAGIGAGGLLKAGRASAIGTSITATGLASWFKQLCLYSEGMLRLATNAGVASNTTTQMVARIATDIQKTTKSDIVFIEGGTNDTAISDALTVQNIVGMYKYAQAIGSSACVVLMPPRSDSTVNRDKIISKKLAVQTYCAENGLVLIDPFRNFVATDGGWLSGASSDGIHPTAAVAREAALDALDQLSPMLQQTWDGLPAMTGVPGAIITTNDFLFDTNMDGAPDGWAGYATNALVTTKTTVAGAIGNVWRMETVGVNGSAVGVAGERVEERTISGLTLAAGTRIAITARVSLEGYDSGIRCHVRCLPNGGSSALALEPTVFSGDLEGAIVWSESVVPGAGSTSILIQFRLVTTGTSTPSVGAVELSEIQIWNLTEMGIV